MMRVSRKISRQSRSPHVFHLPQPPQLYTPTPDGFERCMRAWFACPRTTFPHPVLGTRAHPATIMVFGITPGGSPPRGKVTGDGVGEDRTPEDAARGPGGRGRPSRPLRKEAHDMRTTRHPTSHVLPLVGIGLMLAGLFGAPALSAEAAAGLEPSVSQEAWGYQTPWRHQSPWGQQGYWGYRDPWGQQGHGGYRRDWPHPRPRYELPDRYTIHKGKKCELRCERIRGTRDYSCREYRC
jgi:hypothetical protein